MPVYQAFIPQGDMSLTLKDKVKRYILSASHNEAAQWPSSYGVLLRNGQIVAVKSGDSYSDYGSEIYLRHRVGEEVPIWLPPTLSCMSQFFQVANDPEVQAALVTIAVNMAADIFRPLKGSVIVSPDGAEVTTIAINSETRQVAGVYPPDPDDPDATMLRPIARLPFSGEIVDITHTNWTIFSLQS